MKIVTDPATRPQPEWLDDCEHSLRALPYRTRGTRAQQRVDEGDAAAQLDGGRAGATPAAAPRLLHPSGKPARVELARCCYPIPGDAILGLASQGRLVLVHRACCLTLLATLAQPYSA